jgi:hypothetical protein
MKSEDLKLFALFYIKEDEVLSDKEKIQLMDFVGSSNDEGVLFLLASGQMPGEKFISIKEDGDAFRIEESYETDLILKGVEKAVDMGVSRYINPKSIVKTGFYAGKAAFQGFKTYKTFKGTSKHESPVGQSTMFLGGTAAASMAASLSYKLKKKHMKKMGLQCDKEKGKALTVCHNKVRRDAIRVEILSLSSMKVKCRKTRNSEKCIKKIEQRIKELQNRMDSIKVF